MPAGALTAPRGGNSFGVVAGEPDAGTGKDDKPEPARRLGTTQSAVARLEGGRVSPSFATLRRYAEATGTRLTVGLVPADG